MATPAPPAATTAAAPRRRSNCRRSGGGFDAKRWRRITGSCPFNYSLDEALKHGPVVVYFFPAAHTAGCNLEAHLFSEAIDDFKAAGASVIGVTAGNTDELADFSRETEHCGGKFPVAADPGAKIAREYETTLDKKPEWSSRTSYVIAPSGAISAVYSDLNPNRHVQEMLDAVKALHAHQPD